MVIQINEQIAEFQKSNLDVESTENLIEFQELSEIQKFVFEDSEGFYEIESYEDLLNEMAQISSIKINNVKVIDEEDVWQFHCNLDENHVSFEIMRPNSDWLSDTFITEFNSLISDSEKKFRFVNVFGGKNVDQCFQLIFVDDKILKKLQSHPKAYAFSDVF